MSARFPTSFLCCLPVTSPPSLPTSQLESTRSIGEDSGSFSLSSAQSPPLTESRRRLTWRTGPSTRHSAAAGRSSTKPCSCPTTIRVKRHLIWSSTTTRMILIAAHHQVVVQVGARGVLYLIPFQKSCCIPIPMAVWVRD